MWALLQLEVGWWDFPMNRKHFLISRQTLKWYFPESQIPDMASHKNAT
jgi:hypothetical protein